MLYIVLTDSPDLDVYDIETLTRRPKLTVDKLVHGFDIVAHANVLYVSEYEVKLIHRIQLLSDGTSLCARWSVNSQKGKMSINQKGNVLVSCFDLNQIIEYTTIGTLVREITVNAIDTKIRGVQHAIQLDDDLFLISHSSQIGHRRYERVCVIDSKGRMMKSYGGLRGSEIGHMNGPSYLAIDRNGFILVVDHNNKRIIQLNAWLEFIRVYIPGSWGLNGADSVYFHERRLYIEECGSPSIAIFDF